MHSWILAPFGQLAIVPHIRTATQLNPEALPKFGPTSSSAFLQIFGSS